MWRLMYFAVHYKYNRSFLILGLDLMSETKSETRDCVSVTIVKSGWSVPCVSFFPFQLAVRLRVSAGRDREITD